MKRFVLLLLSFTLVLFVATGLNDSSVTKRASTEQVAVQVDDSSTDKISSFDYEVPSVTVVLIPALGTPKPTLIYDAEKTAEGFVAGARAPPDRWCSKIIS